jgi:hypothetical protein
VILNTPARPQPPGEITPDVRTSPAAATEPIIIDSLTRYGGLDTHTRSLAADHPLVEAVNGVNALSGGTEIGARGRIVDPERFGPFDRRGTGLEADGASGSDPARVDRTGSRDGQLIGDQRRMVSVEGNVIGKLMSFRFTEADPHCGKVAAGRISVTLADGSPLPEWLSWRGEGMLVGEPPADLTDFDILVRIEASDGSIATTRMRVSVEDGKIVPVVERQGALEERPQLFSEQIRAASWSPSADAGNMTLAEIIRATT